MVKWVIDNVNISDRTLHKIMGSFTPDNLPQMYHLQEPQKLYEKYFLEHFAKENEDPIDVTQSWRLGSDKFKWEKYGMYPISSLSTPHNFVAVMIFRLFGKADSTKFSIEWVPLIVVVVNAIIMNWIHILSDNLAMDIKEYR